MRVFDRSAFQSATRSCAPETPFVVVKPNWVSDREGGYTDAEVLSWFLGSLQPDQQVVIVESYTLSRGPALRSGEVPGGLQGGLISGRRHWASYRKQDEHFLQRTGLADVLRAHHAEYINVTDEYWKGNCCAPEEIGQALSSRGLAVRFSEFLSYVPTRVHDIREQATFVSLAKIKVEQEFRNIVVSLSLKNLFGLIPHPDRHRYHGPMDRDAPEAIADINRIYASLFPNSLWIAEGVHSYVEHYGTPNRTAVRDAGLLFVGRDPVGVDTQVCEHFGIDPADVPYLELLSGVWT